MKTPKGTLKGDSLNNLFSSSIDYHLSVFYKKIAEYEPAFLFENWKKIVRCIDEIINIPFELHQEEVLSLFNYYKDDGSFKSNKIKEILASSLTDEFNSDVSARFMEFSSMCSILKLELDKKDYFSKFGDQLNFNNTENRIHYFQSRRLYFVTVLFLIPKVAVGQKKTNFSELLNDFFEILDVCLVNVTTSFQKKMINNCITGYEMTFNSVTNVGVGNFEFETLESFYLNPQRLSLLDQLEFRKDEIKKIKPLGILKKKVFSFSELADTMNYLSSAFTKYEIKDYPLFNTLDRFFVDISSFIIDDYEIIIDASNFRRITSKNCTLILYLESSDYFENLNSISPFQKLDNYYYSTVVLLERYAYNLLVNSLLSNRRFQINSGFVFEDMISSVLEANGFEDLGITRIGRKEFDVVALKNADKIYNFQCKNNYYDIASVDRDSKRMISMNKRLCSYYEKALNKEKAREHLLIDKVGIKNIEHFVVSRFPVITRNPRIINFNVFEKRLKEL